jgi:hypothetical protein
MQLQRDSEGCIDFIEYSVETGGQHPVMQTAQTLTPPDEVPAAISN